MNRNKISHVFAIGYVAQMLGVDEDWLDEISIELEPEDGRILVFGKTEDEDTTAFADFGIESLRELIKELRRK